MSDDMKDSVKKTLVQLIQGVGLFSGALLVIGILGYLVFLLMGGLG